MPPIKILADATLPGLSALFKPPFTLTCYHSQDEVRKLRVSQNILLCRSTLRVGAGLLSNSSIECVATASSGIDHIDSNYLKQHHINLFDAKGSNARAVADYVVATIAALCHHGNPIGKLAGVIGVGEVGSRVVTRLLAAGFEVICFDPLKAQQNNNYSYCGLSDLITCDVLCVHANLHDLPPFPSRNLLNANFFAQLKKNIIIINAARGGIVNEADLLATPWPITYCTDVYEHEPTLDPRLVNFATVCTPHIAGHSIEAKITAVVQISQQLHNHYRLTMPSAERTVLDPVAIISAGKSWQDTVLSLYNPLIETRALKAVIDKESAFLSQRKAHQYRHDFNSYTVSGLDQRTRRLLGY